MDWGNRIMPRPNKIFLIPDIRLLGLDPNEAKLNPNSTKVFVLQLLNIMQKVENIRAGETEPPSLSFYLSPELINSLLTNDFPWREYSNPSLGSLTTQLTALLNRVRLEKFNLPLSTGCNLEPDLTAHVFHIHTNTKTAWRNLISICEHSWRVNNSAFYIKISASIVLPTQSFLRVVRGTKTVGLVELIPQTELETAFLWANESLPRRGDHVYRPHTSWSGNLPFPKGKISGCKKSEPRDESNMIWQWDMLHQSHWDVQTMKGVRLARVTPDGRELPVNE